MCKSKEKAKAAEMAEMYAENISPMLKASIGERVPKRAWRRVLMADGGYIASLKPLCSSWQATLASCGNMRSCTARPRGINSMKAGEKY